jgi:biopolymer transport protein ExbD
MAMTDIDPSRPFTVSSSVSWKIRHQGSPQTRALTLPQIVEGLRDGVWEPTDEVLGPGEAAWSAIENHPQLADVAAELEQPPPRRDDETHLDMTALIDVCLVLLIFFMMTTTYAVAVQKTVPLPTLKEEQKKKNIRMVRPDQVRQQMVRIDAKLDTKGKPVILVENRKVNVLNADETVDAEKLRDEMLPYTRGTPRRDEVLLDAEGVTWGLVVAVQDAARSAGVRMIHYRAGKN